MGVASFAEDRRLMVFEDAHSMWTETALTQEQVLYCHGRISGLGLPTNVVLMWTGAVCCVVRLPSTKSDRREKGPTP